VTPASSPAAHAPAEPEAIGVPPPEVQAAEEHRWLAWFGTPVLVAAAFMAIAFGTGQAWVLTFTVVVLIADILVLIMLVLTSDTNRSPRREATAAATAVVAPGPVPASAEPEADGVPPPEVQAAEEHRWLAWFGTPVLVAAAFMAIAFGTGQAWVLTFTVVVLIADILVLIMLVLTSDTNRVSVEAPATPERGGAVTSV
jgi:hypothetical protein